MNLFHIVTAKVPTLCEGSRVTKMLKIYKYKKKHYLEKKM